MGSTWASIFIVFAIVFGGLLFVYDFDWRLALSVTIIGSLIMTVAIAVICADTFNSWA
jgi:hypothetical protein